MSKVKGFRLISNPDRIRAGEEIVVSVIVDYDDGSTRSGIGVTKKADSESLNQAILSAVENATNSKSALIELVTVCADLGGKQLIKGVKLKEGEESDKLVELNELCTSTQQEEIDQLTTQLGIPTITVCDEYNLATYHCLFSALNKLLDK